MTIKTDRYFRSLKTIDTFIDRALGITPNGKILSGFDYDLDLLHAALANLKLATAVKPYMNTVIGLYFHGSRARGDCRKDPDYDLVLITSDKIDDELKIELKEHNILVEAN